MGMLRKVRHWASRLSLFRGPVADHVERAAQLRICGVEELESRRAMAVAPLHLGSVYYEEASGDDSRPDILEVTFTGGAAGTKLNRVTIDGDKLQDGGLTLGDIFYDTAPGGHGVFNSIPLAIVSTTGFSISNVSVADGSSLITFDLVDWDAGEKLIFSLDVDEQGLFSATALAEGGEFEGSILTGYFTNPNYEDITGQAIYYDYFDTNFANARAQAGSTLNLPPDDYIPPDTIDRIDRTAGAVTVLTQVPKPITLSGVVFHDRDQSISQGTGEEGIANVSLTLMQWNGSQYVSTGQTAVTNASGEYKFTGLLPGKYCVVETQPTGWFSTGSKVGSVNGSIRGTVITADELCEITLDGGEDGVRYDFGEVLPVRLAGRVFADPEADCVFGPNDLPLANVKVELLNPVGSVLQTAFTNAQGQYEFTGLPPGVYSVREYTPVGYFQGGQTVGTAGGVATTDLITGINLGSGAEGLNYDFCELIPARLSGRVWADPQGDCVYGPNDIALGGVTVELLNSSGKVVGTTTTNSQGQYEFVNLAPGVYSVREIQPAGYYQGGQMVGSAGGTASTDLISQIVLGSNADAIHYDFCELLPARLSGRVWADPQGDCVYTTSDVPLANVRVDLLNSGGQIVQTTYTDSQGRYSFTDLAPGIYAVRETQPSGYYHGDQMVGTAGGQVTGADNIGGIVLLGNGVGENYDFCELLPASIAGGVWADPQGDCILTTADQRLSGVTIELLNSSGEVINTITTNAQGEYKFANLAPGTYSVREIQPAGYYQGGQKPGSAGGSVLGQDHLGQIALGSGTNAIEYDFCEFLPASIAGKVFADRDGDCFQDPEDFALSGVKIELLNVSGAVIATTFTDAEGKYEFLNLAPNQQYGIREIQPAGYFHGGEMIGTAGGLILGADHLGKISLSSGENAKNYDFCEKIPVGIRGRVHGDPEGDCIIGPNDILLAGVRIELLDTSGNVIQSTLTNANGEYSFENLPPGVYSVREIQPAGYFQGAATPGSLGGVSQGTDLITQIDLGSGELSVENNFCELLPGRIAGRVWADPQDDCFFGPSDTPLGGVVVQLLDANGAVIRTTLTNAQGEYSFDNLAPGSYGVRELQPTGYFDGQEMIGSAGGNITAQDTIRQITIGSGTAAVQYDFCELLPASLAGRVWADPDEDCVYDEGDQPLAGVTIELLDNFGAVLQTTLTNTNGEYHFGGLEPGKLYSIRERQPSGYFQGGTLPGSSGGVVLQDDLIVSIVLDSAEHAVNYDFCELPSAALSGYVFQDGPPIVVLPGQSPDVYGRRPGIRGADSIPIPGVKLLLGDSRGNSILDAYGNPRTTTTNAQGYYEFTGLTGGQLYTVRQVQPQGFLDNIDRAGTTSGLAINRSVNIALLQFEFDVPLSNYDFIARINVPVGVTSRENNFSEVVVETILPPPDILRIPPPPTYQFTATPATPPQKILPFIPAPEIARLYIDGTGVRGKTWHLSVIDAGQPRTEREKEPEIAFASQLNLQTWNGVEMSRTQWSLYRRDGQTVATPIFGNENAIPVPGDYNGDGQSELGVYIRGEWFIDLNANGRWDKDDLWAKLGTEEDLPVVGDWDGDGKDDIGIYGPAWPRDPEAILREPGLPIALNPPTGKAKNMPPLPDEAPLGERTLKRSLTGKLRADLIDHVFHYGTNIDHPVTGDWTGQGSDSIGVYNNGEWRLDVDGDGKFSPIDLAASYGANGDQPIVGDWDGDGVDQLGVYRGDRFILDTNNNRVLDESDEVVSISVPAGMTAAQFSQSVQPVAADWDGDGRDEVGLYHSPRRVVGQGTPTSAAPGQ
ncbi:MAG: SdrD B-like domain-containing protein [Pirellulales bacterium]|nr:SdrD B-like domain-containing protein [Pirellulales bacterium]